jgi:hypothetical protein
MRNDICLNIIRTALHDAVSTPVISSATRVSGSILLHKKDWVLLHYMNYVEILT